MLAHPLLHTLQDVSLARKNLAHVSEYVANLKIKYVADALGNRRQKHEDSLGVFLIANSDAHTAFLTAMFNRKYRHKSLMHNRY